MLQEGGRGPGVRVAHAEPTLELERPHELRRSVLLQVRLTQTSSPQCTQYTMEGYQSSSAKSVDSTNNSRPDVILYLHANFVYVPELELSTIMRWTAMLKVSRLVKLADRLAPRREPKRDKPGRASRQQLPGTYNRIPSSPIREVEPCRCDKATADEENAIAREPGGAGSGRTASCGAPRRRCAEPRVSRRVIHSTNATPK